MPTALSLYCKSSSAYRECVESNLLILLSEVTRKTKRQTLSVYEGYCSNIYSIFYDGFIKNKTKSIDHDNEKVI